jgi:hypothetical protein
MLEGYRQIELSRDSNGLFRVVIVGVEKQRKVHAMTTLHTKADLQAFQVETEKKWKDKA